jgi:hypothetical protein
MAMVVVVVVVLVVVVVVMVPTGRWGWGVSVILSLFVPFYPLPLFRAGFLCKIVVKKKYICKIFVNFC